MEIKQNGISFSIFIFHQKRVQSSSVEIRPLNFLDGSGKFLPSKNY